jgi:hypothetical protein
MCPSTEAGPAERQFAIDVMDDLLQRIENENQNATHEPYEISYAWTEGAMIYIVYTAPPSDRTWGLARDTRQSIVGLGPWQADDQPALYYYLIDFEENQPWSSSQGPDDDDTIYWFGHPASDLPKRPAELPEEYRYVRQSTLPAAPRRDVHPQSGNEPRRYGNRT